MKAMQYLRKLNAPVPNVYFNEDTLTDEDWEFLGKDICAYVSVFMKNASLGEQKLHGIYPDPEEDCTTFIMDIPDHNTKETVGVGFRVKLVDKEPAKWELVNVAALSEFSYSNAVDLLEKSVKGWLNRSGVAFSVFWHDSKGKRYARAGYAFDGSHALEKAEICIPEGCVQDGKVIMSHHPSVPAAIAFAYCLNKRNGVDTRWDLPTPVAG
jgi:hypothetical protein